MKVWVAKAALPLILTVGVIAAWGVALGSTDTAGRPRAWIDAPIDGTVLRLGSVKIQAHGGGVDEIDRIRLFADDVEIATRAPTPDGRVATATFVWSAPTGDHILTVRAHGAGGWGPTSEAVHIRIADGPDRAVVTTSTTMAPGRTTTTSPTATTSTTSSSTTTIAVPPPTAATSPPATSAAPPITTRLPGLTLLVDAQPNPGHEGEPVTIIANLQGVAGHDATITIEATENPRNPASRLVTIGTCRTSPCVIVHTFTIRGRYQYRATAVTDDGRRAASSTKTLNVVWK